MDYNTAVEELRCLLESFPSKDRAIKVAEILAEFYSQAGDDISQTKLLCEYAAQSNLATKTVFDYLTGEKSLKKMPHKPRILRKPKKYEIDYSTTKESKTYAQVYWGKGKPLSEILEESKEYERLRAFFTEEQLAVLECVVPTNRCRLYFPRRNPNYHEQVEAQKEARATYNKRMSVYSKAMVNWEISSYLKERARKLAVMQAQREEYEQSLKEMAKKKAELEATLRKHGIG